MSSTAVQQVKITVADPSALGLFGLAMVTFVASSQKLGITTGLAFVLPWAIFLGAFVQLIACLYDFKHNNVFGATAFGAYAFFWFGVAASWLIKLGVFGDILAANADPKQLAIAFAGYFIFSLFMTIGAMETHKVLFSIFVLIDVLLLCLAIDTYSSNHTAHIIAAWSELFIALLSFYGAGAAVLNKHFGKVFLPVGQPFGVFK